MATLGLLGKLPLELCNAIYSLVLTIEDAVEIQFQYPSGNASIRVLRQQRPRHPNRNGNRQVSIKHNEAALLFVSKQVCAETAPIL